MKTKTNPFHLKGYHGVDLFCDREKETDLLIENIENSVNTTLLAIRRMGKTGLIHHVFNQLESSKNYECIYVDIFATQNLSEFTNELASSILKKFPQNHSIGKKFIQFIQGFSPMISYDPLTGSPEISLNFSHPQQYKQSLKGLFSFLETQKKPIVVAIDEFQQIANYPEKNTEALLRTIIQNLNNVDFIFSGSHKHLLLEIFNSTKRPFFASTNSLSLAEIPENKYSKYIKNIFEEKKKIIDSEAISFILNWTRRHTYYTQAVCNKVFAQSSKKISLNDVYFACDSLLKEKESIYFQYRQLLTSSQWQLLKAIAKEDIVFQPTGFNFVSKYNLGNPASVKRSLEALIKKEMVYNKIENNQNQYMVYDCFLSRWLAR